MSFTVRFSPEAEDDLLRLFDDLVDRAKNLEDLARANVVIEAIRSAVHNQLASTPYSFRKVGRSVTRRELIVPFGAAGYVALFEIESRTSVLVLALRHQLEDDYH